MVPTRPTRMGTLTASAVGDRFAVGVLALGYARQIRTISGRTLGLGIRGSLDVLPWTRSRRTAPVRPDDYRGSLAPSAAHVGGQSVRDLEQR